MKTSLGSSPQRHPSLAPPSTIRPSLGSPIRAKQIASVRRRLDFSEVPQQTVEFSPPKVNAYLEEEVGVENIAPQMDDHEQTFQAQDADESIHMLNGADGIPQVMDDTPNAKTVMVSNNNTPLPTTARRKAKTKSTAKRRASNQSSIQSTPGTAESLKRKRGRPAKPKAASKLAVVEPVPEPTPESFLDEEAALPTPEDSLPPFDESVIDPSLLDIQDDTMAGAMPPDESEPSISIEVDEPIAMPPPPKPMAKKSKMNVHIDYVESASEDERPSKRARKGPVALAAQKKGASKARNSSNAPKARDPNARKAPPKRKAAKEIPDDDSDEESVREGGARAPSVNPRTVRGVSKPRSLQILRQGTPMEEAGATKTRSGRQSVQPLAWWCGERVNRDFDGTIKDVIRAETVERSPRVTKNNGSRKAKRRALDDIEEEDEAEELEPWEADGGILTGLVRGWDAEYNMTMEDEDVEMGMEQ